MVWLVSPLLRSLLDSHGMPWSEGEPGSGEPTPQAALPLWLLAGVGCGQVVSAVLCEGLSAQPLCTG